MDIICVGEMLIDFTPGKENLCYKANPGGAPANVAISTARNGLDTAFLGKLGNDDFGRLLVKTLEDDHVKVLCEKLTDKAVTTLAFVTLYEGGERSFTFVRKPGADILLDLPDIKAEDVSQCRLLHCGSVSLSDSPSREAVLYAAKTAHDMGKIVSFDINYRNMIWGLEDAMEQCEKIYPYIDLLKISDEELSFVGGEENIETFMHTYDIKVLVETLGAKGAKYYYRGNGQVHSHFAKGRQMHAVDATGAGDAFWGGFLSSLLFDPLTDISGITEDMVRKALAYGNVSGALCVQHMGGIPALPTKKDILSVLDN